MAEYTIMLACAAGMSTSMLVAKMQKAADANGQDVEIFATAANGVDDQYATKHPDILLLGPQVRFMQKKFAEKLPISVQMINMSDYGMMNGEKVLKDAISEIQSTRE